MSAPFQTVGVGPCLVAQRDGGTDLDDTHGKVGENTTDFILYPFLGRDFNYELVLIRKLRMKGKCIL